MRHTATMSALALSLLAFAAPAVAQPDAVARFNAAYTAAMAEGRYADAVEILRERLQLRPAAHPSVRAGYARALLLAGRREEAHAAAAACTSDPIVAEFCAQVLRESEPPAAPAPVRATIQERAQEPPRPVVVRPVVRVSFASTQRTWAPTAGPVALWSVGAAAVAAAGVLVILRDDALSGCAVSGADATCQDAASLERARGSVGLTTAANVSAAVGATAIVAGTAWWLLGGRTVVPVVSPDGVYVAFAGQL